jgi:hypothetical protein
MMLSIISFLWFKLLTGLWVYLTLETSFRAGRELGVRWLDSVFAFSFLDLVAISPSLSKFLPNV